jgi:hypothetical protein
VSAAVNRGSDWNYRINASRQVTVKGKNGAVRKISAIDVLTNLPFPIEVPQDFQMATVDVGKAYFVTFKVYTLKKTPDVSNDFVEFFQVLDVDQSVEDFIKAYWLFPNYIRFELNEAEPL